MSTVVKTEVQKEETVSLGSASSEASTTVTEKGTSDLDKMIDELEGKDAKPDEKVTEEKKAEETVEKDADKVTEDPREVELAELRQIAREQKRRLESAEQTLAKTNKLLEERGLISEDDKTADLEARKVYETRLDKLEEIVEIMILNPKYEDLQTVVSQENFDDMVEMMADAYVTKNGGKADEVVRQLYTEIWAMPNPYRYMYDQIKTYHPKFKKAEKQSEGKAATPPDGTKVTAKDILSEGKPATKVATSTQDIPGGAPAAGGWTAKMIDDLPEDQLGKVPQEVYQRYLKNLLP
jgi:hypothetical protein